MHIALFIRGKLSFKDGVAPRVSAKLAYNLVVGLELVKTLLHHGDVLLVARDALALHSVVLYLCLYQVYGHLVVLWCFGESQGRTNEQHLVVRVHFLIVGLLDYVFGNGFCIYFELVCAFVASKHDLCKELEHYYDGKHAIRIVIPIVVLALCKFFEVCCELARDLVI